jgi:hypothetical protein
LLTQEIVQDELRIDGIISAERPSMDLETTSTAAGTDKGMQVASEPHLPINSLYCRLADNILLYHFAIKPGILNKLLLYPCTIEVKEVHMHYRPRHEALVNLSLLCMLVLLLATGYTSQYV